MTPEIRNAIRYGLILAAIFIAGVGLAYLVNKIVRWFN